MAYFVLKQDPRWLHAVEVVGGFSTLQRSDDTEDGDKSKRGADYGSLPFHVRTQSRQRYVDYLERPLPLLSDKLKRLVEKYAAKMPVRSAVLIDQEQGQQQPYWIIAPPVVDCLSEATEFYLDGSLKQLVIEKEKVGPYHLFKLGGIREDMLIVSLALAESMLRRDFTGIRVEHVDMQ
ncbi:imm11 family protein [Paenibacillus arenosi]|uniref:Serine protease n=1 Tax=Paenibacillus arenosi TaxID=2774142 RepID=A0ABR9AXE1_9BACL|nr:serine protease [Paenibacillus arenosi]MBD8498797.1 serine protease [Paenibacillus arenosi]